MIVFATLIAAIFAAVVFFRRKPKSPQPSLATQENDMGNLTRVLPVGMLIAKTGVHRGLVFPIDPAGLKIGRDKGKNTVVIDSDVISREHVWIGLENGKVVIKDLSSRNGTYINSLEDARVQTAVLKDGDMIYLGKNGAESFKFKAS